MEENRKVEVKFLLPLGSVVRLKGAEHRLMITAYFVSVMDDPDVKKPEVETEAASEGESNEPKILGKMYDYLGVLWPEGDVDSKRKIMFNRDAIEDIYFYGYSNDEFAAYKDNLKRGLNPESESEDK